MVGVQICAEARPTSAKSAAIKVAVFMATEGRWSEQLIGTLVTVGKVRVRLLSLGVCVVIRECVWVVDGQLDDEAVLLLAVDVRIRAVKCGRC